MVFRLFTLWLACVSFGCVNLDGFVYNPIHCSEVGPSTCEQVDEPWDRFCVPCDQDYQWDAIYPWMPETLAVDQSVRPIAPSAVSRHELQTTDGQGVLDVYELKGHGERIEVADTTIVYNHGNKGGIEHYLHRVRLLYEAGFNVVVWDYRGYGKSSEGTATGQQLLADARQVAQWSRKRALNPQKVIIYGYSLGAVPATHMAEHSQPCALLLEAPWTSLERIALRNAALSVPDGFLSTGSFDNLERATRIKTPTLVMSGQDDTVFPAQDIELLYGAFAGPKELWILPGVRHGVADGGVPLAGFDAYIGRVLSFIQAQAPQCL